MAWTFLEGRIMIPYKYLRHRKMEIMMQDAFILLTPVILVLVGTVLLE
jgi:hypothetical protein